MRCVEWLLTRGTLAFLEVINATGRGGGAQEHAGEPQWTREQQQLEPLQPAKVAPPVFSSP